MEIPIVKEVFLRAAQAGVTGSVPGIDTIIGSALGVKSGSSTGHSFALKNYGADALFGMVKTAIGLSATNDELKELVKQALLVDLGRSETTGQNNKIILPSYMDAELKDCIACDFAKDNIPVQICEEGQTFNWVSGKCERQMFNGIDCYEPYKDKTDFTDEKLPKGIIECENSYYFNTRRCEKTDNIFTQSPEQTAIESLKSNNVIIGEYSFFIKNIRYDKK